ncbi:M28 family metallopeptidase [Vibrio sagamiensis]|nr:M28 family metallopeptidase [Vibrio sagamiensis]
MALIGSMMSPVLFANTVGNESVWITTDADALHLITEHGAEVYKPFSGKTQSIVAKIEMKQLAALSSHMHHDKHRCGGYMVHENKAIALKAASMPISRQDYQKPTISHQEKVRELIAQIEPNNMVETIENLSNFTNRFYTTSTGIEASDWLLERWQQEIEGIGFGSARQVTHADYPQKSVELTLLGKTSPEQIIVIGGHLDSTVGNWTQEGTISPGADDDASGIATVTEALRLMIASGVQPDKTIKFYGYAAEEVGLRGSQDIAQSMKDDNANVLSVLQLDMTNYNGSANDITFISDYTDSNLNQFLSELIDTYADEISYDFDRCGYACSDHASWHNLGYSASMPFETMFSEFNPHIHTKEDTLENSDPTASHATKFAKLAIAYLIESSLNQIDGAITLEDGQPVEDLEAGYGEVLYFTFTTEEEGEVTINLMGPSKGDADLFVKYNDAVSTSNYDCRPFQNGSNETCVLTKPAGTFNIMVRGYRNFDETSIKANFTAAPIQ